ncbi:hypothetical protein K461DRAFT_6887 [Myriangium duriaei CBS 260.36]|uniref:Uncharacterized protein n=1 Tax=Myriangium duriaei CBS 260.36 TaxID=1168546 RepID=A0A9P4J8I8_9PEZI|nr:hypothetical protein K461DRAFT_6887 [Myriangium duriaei CBS 260.36]
MEQQLSAMEQERKEIRRQRDTFDEQVQLANSDSQHLEGLLAAQKEANAAVRKRHGYTALEEAKDAAVAALADEQATRAKLEANVARLEADAARAAEEMAQLQATVDKLRKGRAAAAGDAPEQSPGLSQGLSSPELVNGGETPPWSQPGSPDPRQSFRTVHGQHRPDGSFGGYRNRYGSRRPSGAGELDGVKRTVSWQSGTLEEERELYGRG